MALGMQPMRENIIYQTVRQIIHLLAPKHRKKAVLMTLLILISGLLDVVGLAAIFPVIYLVSDITVVTTNPIISRIYYNLGFANPQNFIFAAVGALVILFIVKNIISMIFQYFLTRFSYQVSSNLTERKFKEFYSRNILEIKNENSNVTANNIVTIPIEFSIGIMLPIFGFFSELTVTIIILTSVAIFNYKLLILLVSVLLPAVLIFYRVIKTRSQKLGKNKNRERYMMYQYLYQNIHGYVDVLLNNKISFFLSRYFQRQRLLYVTFTKLFVLESSPSKFIEVAGVLGIFLIFVYAYIADLNSTSLFYYLIAFALMAVRLMPSINRMIISLVKVKSTYYVLDILRGLPNDSDDNILNKFSSDQEVIVPEFHSSLEFKNVSFAYKENTPLVLKNLSFEVQKGEVVGFIGSSGSGKSTIFNIILRLIKEGKGDFLIDGKPLKDEQIPGWRHLIGYVRQDYYMLDATLAENIAFGVNREEIDLDKLQECIDKASLHDFVDTLPDGIDSHIGEHGGKLSGGQKQRIAIARALYHDSEIILFDEATSSLDNETENEIIETVNNLFGEKKTMLMIAHRYTTLKKCSRIYEISEGKISQVHAYRDLLEKKIFS